MICPQFLMCVISAASAGILGGSGREIGFGMRRRIPVNFDIWQKGI